MPPILLWFRTDLRLSDQPALAAALASGAPVIPVFVLDETSPGKWAPGGASRWWLHHSLAALDADLRELGSALVLRRGVYAEEVARLMDETGACEIHTGDAVEPWARRAIAALAKRFALHAHRTRLLFHPSQIKTGAGTPFGVYTPFAHACRRELPPRHATPRPPNWPKTALPRSDRMEDWQLLPTRPNWAEGWEERHTPGEAGAQARLRDFLRNSLDGYAARRDFPAEDCTSRLSPHLAWGEISADTIWQASLSGDSEGAEKFRAELLWREFSAHLLHHQPALPDHPWKPEYAALPWRDDPQALDRWRRGQTGIPIVDAGMRQLWRTGWMHNRVRMIAASFLIKHLLIDWRAGEAWFWDTLVDADLANNAASWQWVAGSGADAAPFFRIFNPDLQAAKFDPDGRYIRRFAPELAEFSGAEIQTPGRGRITANCATVPRANDRPRIRAATGAGGLQVRQTVRTMANKPRLAVIGAGISGLSAAWLARHDCRTTLFEALPRAGGHADTQDVEVAGRPVAVDTGFIVYNALNYPNLVGLFAALGVETLATDMSFGVSIGGGRMEYAGGELAQMFAQKRNLLRPRFWRMTRDILRFYRAAPELLASAATESLGEYLDRNAYGPAFVEDHLLPMGAAIWSASVEGMRAFPARHFVRFFHNHGLLKLAGRPAWRTVKGGARHYVGRIVAQLDDVRLGCGVRRVAREADGIALYLADGSAERFDRVILACHADQALVMLDAPAARERDILSAFRFQENRAVLHTDVALMPRRRGVWSAWNYLSNGAADHRRAVSVTYWMNRLQSLETALPLLVTLNPLREPVSGSVLLERVYSHPQFDAAAMDAQTRLADIQGEGGVYFCGAWTGWGFHEDGIASAVRAVGLMGVAPPWGARQREAA
jgi:uncharacterized protein